MLVFPNAKINLGLYVTGNRPDGYHDVETVFYPLPLCDVLEVVPRRGMTASSGGANLLTGAAAPDVERGFVLDTPDCRMALSGIPVEGDPETNLCVRAYRMLAGEFRLPPVDIALHKQIPSGAGLGGGSSDGAYMLTVLNRLFGLCLDGPRLAAYASRLGSDCAFFLRNSPAVGTGRGEVLTPVDVSLSGYYLVLLTPDVHVRTADAYRQVVLRRPEPSLETVMTRPPESWPEVLCNDFESSVFRQFPLIATLKQRLYQAGACYASMSGSGSSVFGLFRHPVAPGSLPPGMRHAACYKL